MFWEFVGSQVISGDFLNMHFQGKKWLIKFVSNLWAIKKVVV